MTIKTNKRDLSSSQVDKLLNMSDEEFEILFSEHFAHTQTLEYLIKAMGEATDNLTIAMLAKSVLIKITMKG